MNWKKLYVLIGMGFIAIILIAGLKHAPNQYTAPKIKTELQAIDQVDKGPVKKESVDTPTVSGIVGNVPWEKDERFIALQRQYDLSVCMASFCTVLRDPLPGEENNVHHGAAMLAGTIIKPGKVFSQNRAIGPYNQARGYQKGPVYLGTRVSVNVGGGVCKIASTVYNVAILSNLKVIERHSHGMPVPYVPYGQDATVSYGVKDIKFVNNTGDPIMIWAQGVDNRLYMAIYGRSMPPRVEWRHEKVKSIKSYNIYQSNWTVPSGIDKKLLEGMDGAIVKTWIDVYQPDGRVQTKYLGKSYYSPMPHVVEKGRKTSRRGGGVSLKSC